MRIKPVLQSLTGESSDQRTVNTSDNVQLDISARGFWILDQIPNGILQRKGLLSKRQEVRCPQSPMRLHQQRKRR